MTVSCKKCGEPVCYYTLESGRHIPFEPEPREDGTGFLGEDNVIRIVTPEPKEFKGQMVAMLLHKAHRCRF